MSIKVGKVAMVSLKSIIVEDRIREVMGDLDSLEQNMKETGLISPLAVIDNDDGTFNLLAGERRYTVLSRNQVEEIPVRIYSSDISMIERKVIEKSENFFRKDMEYWEMDKLTLEITEMQQTLKGVKAPGPGSTGWSLDDTAELIGGVSKATVSNSIKRAQAREAFPELFENCKTANDASKALKKLDEALVKQVIAQKLEAQTSNVTLKQLSNCFIINDFFAGVKEIPDNIMHLVEIDPPYAIALNSGGMKKRDGESKYDLSEYNEVDATAYPEFLYKLFKECYRVMAQHSWLVCWFAPEPWMPIVRTALEQSGFDTSYMCGIWSKGGSGQNMHPEIRLTNTYEMFFYAWKGSPALNKPGRSNVFNFPPVPAQQKTHPTERPIELMKELYDTFSFTGSRVLIPFLGSGNGLIAAHQLGLSAVGFELSKSYKDSFLIKVNNLK